MKPSYSKRLLVATFEHELDILAATRKFRDRGHEIVDVFTPYAVHGMDEAMGLRPTRLPWVCFLFGLAGATFKVWYEFWTTAVNWPVNVGGKPFNSLPAFVPITFEVMVLLAGLSTVAALLFVARLYPGRKAVMPSPRVTNDHFILVVGERDATFVWSEAEAICRAHNALDVREEILEERR